MPVRAPQCAEKSGDFSTPYNVEEHLFGILVPLPSKVYIKAEIAELMAWNYILNYADVWPSVRDRISISPQSSKEFISELRANRLIARTYLTHGWKYKRRILNNNCPHEMKNILIDKELPRFVWVTEFGILSELNHREPSARRIRSHVVIDATTSELWDSGVLVVHAPGMLTTWSHSSHDECGPYERKLFAIPNDCEYLPRIRGQSGLVSSRKRKPRTRSNGIGSISRARPQRRGFATVRSARR